uniref:EGF-like domain-containing protein n=1 Tax=Myripristis murdjan TaxID=586833 RepID=A0A667Z6D4_9TELE
MNLKCFVFKICLCLSVCVGSMEEPRVQRLHAPCREEYADYCQNDGQCMYLQDIDTPLCLCKPSYSGERCMFITGGSQSPASYEERVWEWLRSSLSWLSHFTAVSARGEQLLSADHVSSF